MSAIIVRGKNQCLIGQREQLARYRIVLNAGVAAREIGAAGAVDEQDVAGEDAILREQADRIRRVARRVEDAEFFVADLQHLAVFDMDCDVRRGREKMHRDRRVGQRAQLHRAAAMIGVSMRVDDQIQAPSVIGEDREVALDLVAQRIDDDGLATGFRDRDVGFALAVIEFAKDHFRRRLIARLVISRARAVGARRRRRNCAR